MEALIRRGTVVPSFTLPDIAGQPVRRMQYRGRRHLVLAFLPTAGDVGAQAYLRALAGEYAALRETGAEVLVILRERVAALEEVGDLVLPFPLLIDADGQVTARFVPPEARAGVFVTDRYGELYYSVAAPTATALPPIGELRDWLEAIDRQCAY
jgi:peroxiredoxin